MKTYNFNNSSGMSVTFLENGTMKSIENNGIMVNLFQGTMLDGSITNFYLRILKENKVEYYPLISNNSKFKVIEKENYCEYSGKEEGIKFTLSFSLAKDINRWFWNISATNTNQLATEIDFVYIQDIGIADKGAISNNESYVCQYIDHTIYNDKEYGYLICSRQNQEQKNKTPWIMSGNLDKSDGFLTDGFQFFGLASKESGIPIALKQKNLINKKCQYEFACHVLKSEWNIVKPGKKNKVTFFTDFLVNHPEVSSEKDLKRVDEIKKSFIKQTSINGSIINSSRTENKSEKYDKCENIFINKDKFDTIDLTENEIDYFFNRNRRNAEFVNGELLSFFYGKNNHVILKKKELVTERPHGHILFSGDTLFPEDDTISSTAWMYGIFNSQVAIGNISFNKFITLSRSRLNLFQSQGQRIFIKRNDKDELLSMPSAFEIGINHCRWIYKSEDLSIIVSTSVSIDQPAIILNIQVTDGGAQEFLISTNMVGTDLIASNFDVEEGKISLFPHANTMFSNQYPNARLDIQVSDKEKINALGGDELLFIDSNKRNISYAVVKTTKVREFSLTLSGTIQDEVKADDLKNHLIENPLNSSQLQEQSIDFWSNLLHKCNLKSSSNSKNGAIETLNEIIPWFAHNAMIHYTKPYGLEQYSGAAWGSRDICQGPVEFLLAFRSYNPVKKILLKVFQQQYKENGEWPQWFMFDLYYKIQHNECHGDIVVWPLKAVCDYIEASEDFSILDEQIPYSSSADFNFSSETESLSEHIDRIISAVKNSFINNTSLISYGDGDWNDSLQPFKSEMRSQMVSVWTVTLLYQTLSRYAIVCQKAGKEELSSELSEICVKMQADFNKYLIKSDIAAGFAYFNDNGKVNLMLHPDDSETGIKYRLLPAQRGIISEIFTPQQAEKHLKMIEGKLLFSDGAHLMDNAPTYSGGECKYFKRAETATFFGREVGTHYVHAHLRYMEALAKLGKTEELMKAFLVVNPINITDNVKNAEIRQSNTYFSSSDPAVADRYEASAKFAQLKEGDLSVKGGWRIYSSGPGIYLSLLVTRLLGIRKYYDSLIIDPVLPGSCNKLVFEFEIENKLVLFSFYISKKGFSPSKIIINGNKLNNLQKEDNPYREGGVKINFNKFITMLNIEINQVEIYL